LPAPRDRDDTGVDDKYQQVCMVYQVRYQVAQEARSMVVDKIEV
jgi:hypothetical protein